MIKCENSLEISKYHNVRLQRLGKLILWPELKFTYFDIFTLTILIYRVIHKQGDFKDDGIHAVYIHDSLQLVSIFCKSINMPIIKHIFKAADLF